MWGRGCPGMPASHTGGSVRFLSSCPDKLESSRGFPKHWGPRRLRGKCWCSSRLWRGPGPALAIAALWAVNQRAEGFPCVTVTLPFK